MEEELTDEERKEISLTLSKAVCKCGHPKNIHNKFLEGRFIGCQEPDCNCGNFVWPSNTKVVS